MRIAWLAATCASLWVMGAPAHAILFDPSFGEAAFVQSPDLVEATGLAWAPDASNRLFVIKRTGEVRIIKDGVLLPTPFATVSPIFADFAECGLVGIAFDPNFLVDPYVYLFVTVGQLEQQIIRYKVSGDTGTEKMTIVSGLPTVGLNHDGGAIGFGPDGKLYWGVGDNGGVRVGVNQDLASLASKVGRANRDGTVPADNPFADGAGPNADYIWARGFRNPFTLTFQPTTGLLWLNVVGGVWEQIFIVRRGDDGGWDKYENQQPAGLLSPVIAYPTNGDSTVQLAVTAGAVRVKDMVTFTTAMPHLLRVGATVTLKGVADPSFNGPVDVYSIPSPTTFTAGQEGPDATSGGGTSTREAIGGCVTGGVFYDASGFPGPYQGEFLFGDYYTGQITLATINPDTNAVVRMRPFAMGYAQAVDLAVGPDGALYQVGHSNGIVRRISYQSTVQGLVVSPLHLWMAEGQGALAMVSLAAKPAQPVTVAVASAGGDADVTVAEGKQLTFTAANWNVPQPVTIAAGRDLDTMDDVATLSVSSAALETQTISVRARDENALALATSTSMLKVNEGKGDSFTVSLSARPSLDVVVSVARASGDGDITASPATLTFTTANWATAQAVLVSAAADVDVDDDMATISVRAPGLVESTVMVLAADDGLVADAGAPDAPVMADAGAADRPPDLAVAADTTPDVTAIAPDAAMIAPPPADAPLADAAADASASSGGSDCGCRLGGRAPAGPGSALFLALFWLLRGRFARARGSATLRTRRVATDNE